MTRDWKPGDVAMIRLHGTDCVAVVRDHKDDAVPVWVISGHEFYKSIAVGNALIDDARPLVVIDPEDREQVERLMRAVRDGTFRAGDTYPGMTRFADAMQAALREFASPTPPKPDEPLGLGAVVEDADGVRHVRVFGLARSAWLGFINEDGGERQRPYDSINAVRVLSEGVTQ